MPLFIVERNFVDELDLTDDDVLALDDVSVSLEIKWLTSFLSADKKKTYCLYEAADRDALFAHAAKLGFPADAIIEVSTIEPGAIRSEVDSDSQTPA